MSFHGFDPGDRNNWYQSPQLGLFPTSPTGYSGGYYCLPSSHLHVTQFPSQPSYRPLPSQFPFQMSCSPPPPPPSHTIINGFVFPHQFPSTHTHHSPDSNPNPWIYPSISQSHSYDPSITSVNSHFVSTKTMPTSSVYHSAPLIPTFQSPSVSSIVPQHQFTVPEPLPLHSKPFRGCRCRVVMGAKARVSKKTRNPDLLHDVGKYSRSKRYPKRGLWVIKAKNGNIFPRHNAKATVAIMEEFHQLLVGQTTPITEPAWSPLTFGSLPAGSVALTAANGSSSMLSVSSRGIRISEKPNFNLSPHEVILGLNKNFITGIHREQTTTTVVTEELVLNVDKNIARGIHGVKFSDIPDGEDDNEDKDDEGGNECVIFGSSAASKELQQDIIDGKFNSESFDTFKDGCPQIHGQFEWSDVIRSVKNLYEVSKTVKERRFSDGALQLDNSKVVILFDEYGDPYDSLFSERKESNSLVEEFMLLANRTAAEVISRAFPNSALLRRHPEPNMRKLKEFEAFCSKHGLEMDTSSSGRFHQSPERIREKLKDDSVLFNILMNYATKPMQLAIYFCSGELKHKENDWGHYGWVVPLYTHFTSPLRRYPDIVVHPTLAAAIEAEELYLEHQRLLNNLNRGDKFKMRCFSLPLSLLGNDYFKSTLLIIAVMGGNPYLFDVVVLHFLCQTKASCHPRSFIVDEFFDFLKSNSKLSFVRYICDALLSSDNCVGFLTNMHKFFQHLVGHVHKDELFMATCSSTSCPPFHALVKKLFLLSPVVAIHSLRPILADILRDDAQFVFEIMMVVSMNELMFLRSKKQSLEIGYSDIDNGNYCSSMSCSLHLPDFMITWVFEFTSVAIDFGDLTLIPPKQFSVSMRSNEAPLLILLIVIMHSQTMECEISSNLLQSPNREALRVFSNMQNLYHQQSNSNSHVSVHLCAPLHAWQVTTDDSTAFGAALINIKDLNMMHSTLWYVPLLTCDIPHDVLWLGYLQVDYNLGCDLMTMDNESELVLYTGYQTPRICWSIAYESRKSNNNISGKICSVSLVSNSLNLYVRTKSLLWQFAISSNKDQNAFWAAVVVEATKISQESCSLPEHCEPYLVCYFDGWCQYQLSSLLSSCFNCKSPALRTCNSSKSSVDSLYVYQKLDYFALGFAEPSMKSNLSSCKEAYPGELPDGIQLAVIKIEGKFQGQIVLRAEFTIIKKIQNVQLVKLRGFCAKGLHKLLVYEYTAKRSLDEWIFKKKKDDHFLDWNTRFSIALGTAKGLAYLHEECNEKIVYCDIKPENVLPENGMQIVHWRSIGRQSCFYLQGDFVSFYIGASISIISEGYLEFGIHLHYANSYSTIMQCNPCSSFKISEFFRQAILYKNLLFLAAATHALFTHGKLMLTGYYSNSTFGHHTDTGVTIPCILQFSLPSHEDMASFKGAGLLGSQLVRWVMYWACMVYIYLGLIIVWGIGSGYHAYRSLGIVNYSVI